ncbi:MAG: molybdopterin synthase sulfur carrier subunit [Thermoprotei archaeon]|nr:MAG: molybdopterin synthase sulfur carrier subunit [Thermoprotei archaeon]
MPKVTFRLFATLRDKYKVKELEVECDGTLRNAVEEAAKKIGEDFINEVYQNGQVRNDRIIMINGRHIQFIKDLKLKDGDVIAIFPPIAGG